MRSEAETIARLWLGARPPEELVGMVRRRLRAEPPDSAAALEVMFMRTLNMPVPWGRAGELLASERNAAGRIAGDTGLSEADARRGIRVAIDDLHGRAANIAETCDLIERNRRARIDVVMSVLAVVVAVVVAMAIPALTAPAQAAVAGTNHYLPWGYQNSGGVTSLCYDATGFSCAGRRL